MRGHVSGDTGGHIPSTVRGRTPDLYIGVSCPPRPLSRNDLSGDIR